MLAVFATPWAADFKLGSQSGAQVGIGTDTGDSVRGPASDCACVGIRPTIGLASRRGIVPARLNRDVPGVLARTVEDTVSCGAMLLLSPVYLITDLLKSARMLCR